MNLATRGLYWLDAHRLHVKCQNKVQQRWNEEHYPEEAPWGNDLESESEDPDASWGDTKTDWVSEFYTSHGSQLSSLKSEDFVLRKYNRDVKLQ